MCFKAENYIAKSGKDVIEDFIFNCLQNEGDREWVVAAVMKLCQYNGKLNNSALVTKKVRGKIFELKFIRSQIRFLFAYHPKKKKVITLLHGIIKKKDKLDANDIEIAEQRYKELKGEA